MSPDQSNRRELSETTREQDPEQLMAMVEELTGVLSRREALAQQRDKAA